MFRGSAQTEGKDRLPVELVENELFGHGSGAFISANAPAAGLFQQAEVGTAFLDEIAALLLSAQVKTAALPAR